MDTRRQIRVGAVSYLNTKPLIHGLEQGLGADRIALTADVPSVLAERMVRGELDVALLPVIELARMPDLEIVPGLGITTFGPSRSVLLVSRVPIPSVERVALDGESRTSNALAQVLFAEVWGGTPEFEIGPLALDEALEDFDAVVRIGDKALFEPPRDGLEVHDLGEVWTRASGLPFVFAAWSALTGVVDREIYRILHESRRRGVKVIDRIAEEFRWNGYHDPALVRGYLMEHIQYRLGAAEVQAMKRFLAAAERLNLVDRVPEIRLALRRWTPCHEIASRQDRAEVSRVEIEREPHVSDRTQTGT
jgi:chorismate dehydratase